MIVYLNMSKHLPFILNIWPVVSLQQTIELPQNIRIFSLEGFEVSHKDLVSLEKTEVEEEIILNRFKLNVGEKCDFILYYDIRKVEFLMNTLVKN